MLLLTATTAQADAGMLPAPSMPEAEAAHLADAFGQASVILEYGSGGSTLMGAQMPGKYILSVESDLDWSRRLRLQLSAADTPSQAVIYHVNIGPTGRWGRAIDESGWRNYHRYPNAIWDEPFFRHPDLIFIDGRFRPACFFTSAMRIRRPVRLLFDDYTTRPKYHVVERVAAPVCLIGRMAEFELRPGCVTADEMSFVIEQYFQVSLSR